MSVITRFLLRSLVAVPAALWLQYLIRAMLNLQTDVSSVAACVGAMGTLYSILTGFTVITVWQQFTDTDRAVKREARNLRELWRYVGYVEDPVGVGRARLSIEQYRDQVLSAEWPAMIAGRIATAAEDEYFAMADAVNGIKVRTAKDVPAWAEAVRTLGEVSDARGERAVFVAVRMPALLRLLLYVATSSLVFGMALLRFEVPAIGGVVIACTVVVSLLVLEVIDDLDDPFRGAWAISTAPLQRIVFKEALATAGKFRSRRMPPHR
jgi:fumarate reductase subunit D